MKLNDQSRQWLYQEAATGNETAKNALRDVNEMEVHIALFTPRRDTGLIIGVTLMATGTVLWLIAQIARFL